MPKTDPEKIAKEVSKDLATFLKNGDISSYSAKIDDDLNIDDLEKLLKIHFLLKENVLNFVNHLPERIRRIKTTTRIIENDSESEIRGKIIWESTLKSRLARGSIEGTSFITRNNERNYAISENLVLEELLKVINTIIENELKNALESDYSWISKLVKEDSKKVLQDAYLRNIYLRRIKDQKDKKVTDRMIDQTMRSRNVLYQESASLLLNYRKLMNYEIDRTEATELLNSTFIKPERTEVLFELYWTIKMINKLAGDEKPKYLLLKEGNNIVAKWEDDEFVYSIFHDSIGSFKFYEDLKRVKSPNDDGYIDRDINSKKKWIEFAENAFQIKGTENLWGGRPDIVVEKLSKKEDKIVEVIIGEVKYTTSKSYAAKGLKELLEYMSFIKEKENGYVTEKTKDIFTSIKVRGILFLDDVKIDPFMEMDSISIYTIKSKINN